MSQASVRLSELAVPIPIKDIWNERGMAGWNPGLCCNSIPKIYLRHTDPHVFIPSACPGCTSIVASLQFINIDASKPNYGQFGAEAGFYTDVLASANSLKHLEHFGIRSLACEGEVTFSKLLHS